MTIFSASQNITGAITPIHVGFVFSIDHFMVLLRLDKALLDEFGRFHYFAFLVEANKFADMTDEEFEKYYLMKRGQVCNLHIVIDVHILDTYFNIFLSYYNYMLL